jgi:hypothetical protein
MTEPDIPPTPASEWDALEVMRVREVMDDQEVLEEFGIDLSRLDP